MQDYLFIGQRRFYSHWEDQSFEAEHGDIKAFANPPGDGLWVPVASAPVVAEAADNWFEDK